MWRKNPGGIYTQDDYNTWRANFGQTFTFTTGSGAIAGFPISAIPEPATLVLLIVAAVRWRFLRRRNV